MTKSIQLIVLQVVNLQVTPVLIVETEILALNLPLINCLRPSCTLQPLGSQMVCTTAYWIQSPLQNGHISSRKVSTLRQGNPSLKLGYSVFFRQLFRMLPELIWTTVYVSTCCLRMVYRA